MLVQSKDVTRNGTANGVAYWFILDYGWNIRLSTLESDAFHQAFFLCKQINVNTGDTLKIRCQLESGLLDFQLVDYSD